MWYVYLIFIRSNPFSENCVSLFFGASCLACPVCEGGTCNDGINGNGKCTCQPGYYGMLLQLLLLTLITMTRPDM